MTIENSQQATPAEQLEALRQATLAITSKLDRDELLREIIERATALLRAKGGGIFEYYPEAQELTVIVDTSREGSLRTTLRAGEGTTGRLVFSEQPYIIIDDYQQWPGRALAYAGKRSFGAVLEVKIVWHGQFLGSLYVEDVIPRRFTEEDANLLLMFADQAAIAMNNAKLVRGLKEGQENLASLSRAAQSLSGQVDPVQVLRTSAEETREQLGCHSVVIWPYDKELDRFLPVDLAQAGIPEADLQEFISRELFHGTQRVVMREGWLSVPNVAEPVGTLGYMKDNPRTELLLKMGIGSFQGVALKVGDEAVGVMFVNYDEPRCFTDEDRLSMKGRAEQAALALIIVRNAQLSEERRRKLYEHEVLVVLSKMLLETVGVGEVLSRAVYVARKVLDADCCSIVLPDKDGRLLPVAQEGWNNVEVGKTEVRSRDGSEMHYIVETGRPCRVVDYQRHESFIPTEEGFVNGIISGMGVPMFRESQVVGALLVHSRTRRLFTDAEENLLALIANQTAIALHSAEQVERQTAYLSGLIDASTSIAVRGFSPAHVLNEIVRQAYFCLSIGGGGTPSLAVLRLYDEATQTLYCESAYPPDTLPELKALLGDMSVSRAAAATRIGIAGRAVLERSPQLVNDVSFDPDYFEFLSSTRSALAVPLAYGDRVLGVLNVESDRPAAFDALHVKELTALGEMAVIAIRNAAQYEELEKTRSIAEARTALALMGMASSTWAHRIRGNATNIRELVLTLRRRLSRADDLSPPLLKELDEKLARLELQATQILEKPLADPLLSAKGLVRFPVRRVLERSIERLQRMKADVSSSVVTRLDSLGDDVTVHCNPEWLGRAFDILLDKAVQATGKIERERHLVEVSAEMHSAPDKGELVKITIADTGPGIPYELREKVLKAKIDEAENSGGSGVGLLMARTIFEAYGGSIRLDYTGDEGTRMTVQLPARRS